LEIRDTRNVGSDALVAPKVYMFFFYMGWGIV
jgi:hypothetical protein